MGTWNEVADRYAEILNAQHDRRRAERTGSMYAELTAPTVECPICNFSAVVQGEWTWVDDRLTFTADMDVNDRRGPNLRSCGECGTRFDPGVSAHDRLYDPVVLDMRGR